MVIRLATIVRGFNQTKRRRDYGGGPPAAQPAKKATSAIPIVFTSGDDPVEVGLVASISRPGGNLTGVHVFFAELEAKKLGLLREVVPQAKVIAALVIRVVQQPSAKRRNCKRLQKSLANTSSSSTLKGSEISNRPSQPWRNSKPRVGRCLRSLFQRGA